MPSPDLIPLESFSTVAAAYIAVVVALVSLTKQGYDIIKHRRREHREIEEALDRQPLVREQLQLGNVGAAVEQLTAIIQQMAEAKARDDRLYEKRIHDLEEREKILELEASEWEERYHRANRDWEERYNRATQDWEKRYQKLDERCRKITAVLRRHNWDVEGAP